MIKSLFLQLVTTNESIIEKNVTGGFYSYPLAIPVILVMDVV